MSPDSQTDEERQAAQLARLAALQKDVRATLARVGRPSPFALWGARLLVLAVIIGSATAGYFLLGWWGVPLGPLAVAAAIVVVVVGHYSLGKLIAGPSHSVGWLRLHIDGTERRAIVSSTFRDEDRSLAALAFAERTLFYWSLGTKLAAPATPLLAALGDLARRRPAELAEGWLAVIGSDTSPMKWAGVERNRLGLGLAMGGRIGGAKPKAEDLNAACIAFVRDAAAADPALVSALALVCELWSKPPYKDTRRFRAAAKHLVRSKSGAAP